MRFKPRALRTPRLDAVLAVTKEAKALVDAAVKAAEPMPRPPEGLPPRRYKKIKPKGSYQLWDGSNHQPGDVVARLTPDYSAAPRGRVPIYVIPAADALNPYAWAAAGYSYSGPVIIPDDEPDPEKRRAFALKTQRFKKELDDEQQREEREAWTSYRRIGMAGLDIDIRGGTEADALALADRIVAWEEAQGVELRVSHSGGGIHLEWGMSLGTAHPDLFRIFGRRMNRMMADLGEVPAGLLFDPAPLSCKPDSRGRLWRIAGGLAKDGIARKTLVLGVAHPAPITAEQLEPDRTAAEARVKRERQRKARGRRKAAEVQGSFKVVNVEALGPFAQIVATAWMAHRPGTGPDRHAARLAIAGTLQVLGFPEADVARIINKATSTSTPRDGRQLASTTRARFLAEGEDGIRAGDWLERNWKLDLRAELALAMPTAQVKDTSAPAAPWDRIGYMSSRLKRRLWYAGQALLCVYSDDTAGRHFREVAGCGAISSRIDCGSCNGVKSYQRKACKRPLCAACWPALVGGAREGVMSEDLLSTWPEMVYVAYTHPFYSYDDLAKAAAKAIGSIAGIRWKHHYAIGCDAPKPLDDLGPAPFVRWLLVADPTLRSGNAAEAWLNGAVDVAGKNPANHPVAEYWRLVPREEAMDMVAMAQLSHYTARAKMLRNGWTGELAESLRMVKGRTFAAGTRDDFCCWTGRKDAELQVIAKAEAERNEASDEPLALPSGRHECPGCKGADVHHCLLYGHGPVEDRREIHRSDYPHSMGQAMKLTLEHACAEAQPGQPASWVPWPARANPQPSRPG